MIYKTDLHIHSTLSPCGSLSSSPGEIVAEAVRRQLDIIAISDHNSTLNLPALKKVSEGKIIPFYGIEVQAVSETHLLVVFDNLDAAMDFGEMVRSTLPDIKNKPDFFGDQVVVDENENITAFEERLLLQSTTMTVEEITTRAHTSGGLVFPSHIDRDSFSIISQLGFIPEDLPIDGIEISRDISLSEAESLFPDYCKKYPVIRNSDAHYLNEIGESFTFFEIEKPSLAEVKKALDGKDGRKCSFDA